MYAASKGMTLPDACKEALFEKIEDEYDSAVAEDAYAEYVASGCKATPINELWKELDHDEEQPNAETVAAIEEVEKLKADPNKKSYGSFAEILAEQPNAETIAAMVEAERIIHDPNARRYQDVEEVLAALKADKDEVEEKLQEAEQEAELTDQRYSAQEVMDAVRATLQGEDLTFKSSLTMEEIEQNFANVSIFKEIKQALNEAIEYERGNLNLKANTRTSSIDDEAADPFFSESNMEFLRRGVEALNAGKGVEHELLVGKEMTDDEKIDIVAARILKKFKLAFETLAAGEGVEHEIIDMHDYEAKHVNEGLTDLENGKIVDGDSVRARIAEKYGV